jgi:hypothetical protein
MLAKAEKDFLSGKLKPKEDAYRWKLRERIRNKAIRGLEDLALIFEQLQHVSRHSDRDYATIFQDENRFFRLVEAMNKAYKLSVEFNIGNFNPEHLPILQDALSKAGMGYYSKTQLKDRRLRLELLERLPKQYYEDIWRQRGHKLTQAEINHEIERSRKLIAWWREQNASSRSSQQ